MSPVLGWAVADPARPATAAVGYQRARARYLLFPGRHHVLTRFQADYLSRLAVREAAASDGPCTLVWAVTSANHGNTRRNPVPYHRLAPVASRSTLNGRPMDWPLTHVLLVARRPVNS
ncbi:MULTISPECIES: hypothetical protein [unclassified Micromonospora]|uniref:hypothetical protein n=1 Tax=unclassified Micromonospora TaxID=2617518 RepID=UPI003A8AC8BF